MIQCTEDVCTLIKSKKYTMNHTPWNNRQDKNYVLTAGDDNNRIEFIFNRESVEIFAFQDKNSKYYERLSFNVFAENEKVKKIRNLLSAKVATISQRSL